MRDAARRVIRRVGVETGGSNIQFAVNPANGRMLVIEMNPRVSRSSALASKATGFPIAKIAAKLALGYHLDEIPNDITRLTPASFEPTIDYIVVKIPRWNFEKFPEADRTLTTQMKSVGEAMAIGRTFKEAFLKGVRSLELGSRAGRLFRRRAGGRGRRGRRDVAAEGTGGAERPARSGPSSRPCGAAGRSRRSTSARASTPGSCSSSPRSAEMERTARRLGFRRALDRAADAAEACRLRRPRARRHPRRGRSAGTRAPARRGHRARLQAHRHLRGRVRVVHPVHVRLVRAVLRVRSEPDTQRSSSWAAGPTASGRASSSTTAAVTRPSPCATRASRR